MSGPNRVEKTTVDTEEIRHFAKDSSKWWDTSGPFAPLHRLNPVRLSYIKQEICEHYALDFKNLKPFGTLDILDIGCGGGLVCEPLTRLGANVTGIDADTNAITAAQAHAKQSALNIDYHCMDAEDLNQKFDVVLALEIIEHVTDIDIFIKLCTKRLKPGGLLILSTINRTPKSYALGIIAAEYLLRWVPRGTHTWKKFVKPSELMHYARANDLETINIAGLIFSPIKNKFFLSKTDLDVNYLISLKI